MSANVKHLDHLNLSVASLAASEAWYRRVFGFERVEEGVCDDGTPWAILRAGEALLCMYEHADWTLPSNSERRERGVHGQNHFGLRITDRAAWEETIRRERVDVDYGGAIRYPRSTSWYVNDPTGHGIEVALWDDDVVRFASAPALSRAGG